MTGFWTCGRDRYAHGLRQEHTRRRRELVHQMQAAQILSDRDRLRLEIEELDRDHAERLAKIGRSLF